jgi:phytoene/squalene synthetase
VSSYSRLGAAALTACEVVGVALYVRGTEPELRSHHQGEFLEDMFRNTGGNAAIAVSFLRSGDRRECRIAYLACRVLDAFEDLAASPQASAYLLRQAASYLTGRDDRVPETSGLFARTRSDELEIKLLGGLEILRRELDELGADRRDRVDGLVADLADAMALQTFKHNGDSANRLAYAEAVLGRACTYVFELLSITPETPLDIRTLGLILQNANDLRDLHHDPRPAGQSIADSRWSMLLDIAAYGVCVPGILDQLRFGRWSRPRGAITYMTATTARFLYRHIGLPVPLMLRFPLFMSFLSALSPWAFDKLLNVLAGLVVTPAGTLLDSGECPPGGRFKRHHGAQVRLENRIILQHPEEDSAVRLFRALQMFQAARSLSHCFDSSRQTASLKRRLALASDFLFARALQEVDPLGARTIAGFSDLAANLAELAELQGSSDDRAGDVAAYLARVVAEAQHVDLPQRERTIETARYRSQQCFLTDQS